MQTDCCFYSVSLHKGLAEYSSFKGNIFLKKLEYSAKIEISKEKVLKHLEKIQPH